MRPVSLLKLTVPASLIRVPRSQSSSKPRHFTKPVSAASPTGASVINNSFSAGNSETCDKSAISQS